MQFITILFERIYKLVTEYIIAVFIMHYITKDIKPVHRLKTIIVLIDSDMFFQRWCICVPANKCVIT